MKRAENISANPDSTSVFKNQQQRAGQCARKAPRSRDGGERSRKFSRILRVFSEYTAPRAFFTRQNGRTHCGHATKKYWPFNLNFFFPNDSKLPGKMGKRLVG